MYFAFDSRAKMMDDAGLLGRSFPRSLGVSIPRPHPPKTRVLRKIACVGLLTVEDFLAWRRVTVLCLR